VICYCRRQGVCRSPVHFPLEEPSGFSVFLRQRSQLRAARIRAASRRSRCCFLHDLGSAGFVLFTRDFPPRDLYFLLLLGQAQRFVRAECELLLFKPSLLTVPGLLFLEQVLSAAVVPRPQGGCSARFQCSILTSVGVPACAHKCSMNYL
jgi:hypothetical protein